MSPSKEFYTEIIARIAETLVETQKWSSAKKPGSRDIFNCRIINPKGIFFGSLAVDMYTVGGGQISIKLDDGSESAKNNSSYFQRPSHAPSVYEELGLKFSGKYGRCKDITCTSIGGRPNDWALLLSRIPPGESWRGTEGSDVSVQARAYGLATYFEEAFPNWKIEPVRPEVYPR